jgi:hypothetical protein
VNVGETPINSSSRGRKKIIIRNKPECLALDKFCPQKKIFIHSLTSWGFLNSTDLVEGKYPTANNSSHLVSLEA